MWSQGSISSRGRSRGLYGALSQGRQRLRLLEKIGDRATKARQLGQVVDHLVFLEHHRQFVSLTVHRHTPAPRIDDPDQSNADLEVFADLRLNLPLPVPGE